MAKHKAAAKRGANKGKGSSKPAAAAPKQHVSVGDRIRLGEEAAGIKAAMTPAQWKQVVTSAHSQGWTVRSALSDTPPELRARTKSSIQKGAQELVTDAYKPADAQMSHDEQLAAGTRAKRIQDNERYGQWLSQRTAQIAQGANAAQAKYVESIQNMANAQKANAQVTAQQAQTQAQQGASGDVSGSIYLKGAQERAQASGEKADANVANAAAQNVPIAQQGQAMELAALGDTTKLRAGYEQDFSKTMSDISDRKFDIATKKAAAYAEQYANDLKTELDKASANRDYQGLIMETQQKQDEARLKHQEFMTAQTTQRQAITTTAATSRANNRNTTSATRAGQQLSHADRVAQRQFDATQKTLDRAATARQKALDRKANATGPAGTKITREDVAASRQGISAIHTLGGIIKGGTFVGNDGKRHKATRANLRALLGASDDQINVAVRWSRGARGARAIRNPAALGILPTDLKLL